MGVSRGTVGMAELRELREQSIAWYLDAMTFQVLSITETLALYQTLGNVM